MLELKKQIKRWSDLGLNIFASVPCSELPPELLALVPFSLQQHGSLSVLGNAGPHFWKNFAPPLDPKLHALDSFSINQVLQWGREMLGEDLREKILYPHKDFHFPLQRLGRLLNLCASTPLGMDISPEHGLWFAFRVVFVTNQGMPKTLASPFESPCHHCQDRPCLNFPHDFQLSRLACPVKSDHRYSQEQLAYHQAITDQRIKKRL